MAGDVLLRRIEIVGQRLDAHLAVGRKTLEYSDAKRLRQHGQAMHDLGEKVLGHWV